MVKPRRPPSDETPKHPEVKAFVLAIKARLNLEGASTREFGRKLGYQTDDTRKKVGAWEKGASAPEFHQTMRLLMSVGWLSFDGLQAYRQAVPHVVTEEEYEAAVQLVETAAQHPPARAGQPDS